MDYRKAVSDYKNAHSKDEKRNLEEYLRQIKGNLRNQIGLNDLKLARKRQMEGELDNLLAPQLFEISKKELAQRDKQAKELRAKIATIQEEVDEIRDNKIFVGAFEWRMEFPEVLDEAGNFTGFDCVIGNPPYIQLQKMGTDADALQKMHYETYERTGDIYCLFYEMGMKLLKPGALLSFITSNGWMKSAYGTSLRSMFSSQYQPSLLIDFAGYKVFDSATVDVNILSVIKSNTRRETIACSIKKDDFAVEKLSDYVQTHCLRCTFGSESWSILSDIERSIKQKVETVGVPLREWDVQIYRGILTGYNDAFIISSEKREEILANCTDEQERERTAAIIRPILRGRDIKRYGYEFADQYIIATFPSKQYNIDDYQALRKFLLSFGMERLEQTGKEYIINGEKVKARKKTNNKWFETQDSISYWDDFSQPKIIWKRVGSIIRFSYDENGVFGLDSTCFATGKHIPYLCCVLNSSMGHYLLNGAPRTGTGDLLISVQAVEPVRVPIIDDNDGTFIELVKQYITQPSNNLDAEIDNLVFELYGLNHEEREYIINNYR